MIKAVILPSRYQCLTKIKRNVVQKSAIKYNLASNMDDVLT